VLVPHYQNPNFVIHRAIDNGVRKKLQGIASPSAGGWSTEGGVAFQKCNNTFELVKKAFCYRDTGSFTVKIKGIGHIVLCPWVERKAH
jgi:hypothetical protein